ncbi:SET domain-containing protein [Candidatus Woesearchaeota archaeon]|nr:SET domain-containing protein [Candidatus Woesearchaeota archaeon]
MNDLHNTWPHRWISNKAESFRSPIQGFGVRATKPIKRGEIVMVIGGIIIPRKDIYKYREIMGHIGIQVHDDFWIVPSDKKEAEETGIPNHSCNPNIGFDGSICYIAIRDIKTGEEILLDYAFMETEFQSFRCNCGSNNCRRIIKPTDWQIPEVQKKFGNYFSPYLKSKILK